MSSVDYYPFAVKPEVSISGRLAETFLAVCCQMQTRDRLRMESVIRVEYGVTGLG